MPLGAGKYDRFVCERSGVALIPLVVACHVAVASGSTDARAAEDERARQAAIAERAQVVADAEPPSPGVGASPDDRQAEGASGRAFLEARVESHVREREACAADYADRARRHAARDESDRLYETERARRVDEAERLRSYQRTRCQRHVEYATARVPCDDGSPVMKICEVEVGSPSITYACSGAAPKEIRGERGLLPSPDDRMPTRVARAIARPGDAEDLRDQERRAWAELEERDRLCASYDPALRDGGALLSHADAGEGAQP